MATIAAEIGSASRHDGWALAAAAPALAAGEVHLWHARLDNSRNRIAAWQQTLSADERARAARFRRPRDRDRFIVGRGILRQILGWYTGQSATAIHFRYPCACGNPHCATERRKPTLDPSCGDATLTFNVSHADAHALYAIARDRPVGVDIERIDPAIALGELVAGVLCASERCALATLPGDRWRDAFFGLWTAKEAYLKGRGIGLTLPPDRVEVALRGDTPSGLLSVGGDRSEAAHWSLRAFQPVPGYTGTVAARGRITTICTLTPAVSARVAADR